jgi:hypothetical protein
VTHPVVSATPTTRDGWAALASRLSITTGLFIDGRYVAARDGRVFDCVNPRAASLLNGFG